MSPTRTLSQYIAEDLAAHPLAPGASVTLDALAKRYQVSLTPVRQAVRELVEAGVLEKTATGRLVYRNNTVAVAPPEPATLRQWEDDLKREILARTLHGESDFLREEGLAERFGVGRTALRHVLSRLAGQGFLTHEVRRGWRVRALLLSDVAAYLVVRERLELLALELAMPRLDHERLSQLRANNTDAGLDNTLHAVLIETADNRYISEFFERQGVYFAALFDWATPEADRVAEMAAQHRAIVEALLQNEMLAAQELLGAHIRAQQSIVEALLTRIRR